MSTYLASTPINSSMPAAMPERCIEWLPTQGPKASDGDWCDITAYVVSGSPDRGRRYETDRFAAGTMPLTLETFDRLFDPEYTAGPFYPWLVPMRQLRVSAVWAGVRYPVFRGYITDWGQITEQDKKYVTTISVKDAFVPLEQTKLPSSLYALEVAKDNPSTWFRLNETGTVRLSDTAGGNYGLYSNCQQGQQGLVIGDSDGAASFAHSKKERVYIQNPALISGYPFTVECLFKADGTDPAGLKIIFAGVQKAPATTDLMYLALLDSGVGTPGAIRSRFRTGGTTCDAVTAARFDDNQAHHLVWIARSSLDQSMYVDGVAQTLTFTGSSVAYPGNPPNGYVIGNITDVGQGDFGFGSNVGGDPTQINRGTIDEVAAYDGIDLPADRIAAHAAAAVGWDGDDSGARVTRFLDAIDWPATLRDIDTGISVLGPASWSSGASALAVLQGWADTELGAFFVDEDGKIVWRSRQYPFLNTAATASQATFGDAAAVVALGYDDIDLPRDETLIRNPVTASRAGGISVTVADQVLIDDKYGDRSWAFPASEDQLDSAVRDRAVWGLARWKELGTRLAAMVITPTSEPLLWPQALGRGLGDRITAKRTPLALGNQISVDQILERTGHTFTRNTWTTKFTGSPVDPNVGDYLILDDAVYGLLDTGILAY